MQTVSEILTAAADLLGIRFRPTPPIPRGVES